jgi:sigma-B regulation protein RsbU (phosphoserine phosphatase)
VSDQTTTARPPEPPGIRDVVITLFELGREVTSVLDLDELLQRIPLLIGRLIKFQAFAVYLLNPARDELSIAYSVGYPDESGRTLRMKVGHGLVGAAVAEAAPILVNDVREDPRYVEAVPGSLAELVVPLRRKGRVIGALNLLSDTPGQFTDTDVMILRQFGAHVAVGIENARLFEQERNYTGTLETLAEIAREFGAILNLDELLTRIAHLARRVIDYRTFGILLVNDDQELEMKVAVRYGDTVTVPRVKLGSGLVGYAALHKEPVVVPDVSADPRYIKVVEDAKSELVIPLLVKDRCIGVFDLESPELDAFTKNHVEILTLLASQAAVAIENARLYQEIRANEVRLEKEVCFAQRVQAALLPAELPKRIKGVDVAARFAPARELGGDLYDFVAPEPSTLVVAVGDVSGKGVPAALYSAFAGELVRSRTYRRRYAPDRFSPSGVLAAMNTILHERQLEEYYCTLCYAVFDFKRKTMVMANSGLPYPVRAVLPERDGESGRPAQIELAGVPLGSFPGSTYDEVSFDLAPGDLFVFCTDGIFEAFDALGREFGAARLLQVVEETRDLTAREIVDRIFTAVQEFRGDFPPSDDMTAVAVKLNVRV